MLIHFQWDFSGMGPFLFAGIIALLMTGLVGMFFPFSKTWDLIYGFGGALLFSGYIVFDVSMPFPLLFITPYPLCRPTT